MLLLAAPLAAGVRAAVRPAGDYPARPVCRDDEVEQTRCEMAQRRQVTAPARGRRSPPAHFHGGPIAAGRAVDWAE